MRSCVSVASTRRSESSGTPAYCARSEARCAIFVPDGVTRCSNMLAATSCSSCREPVERAEQMVANDRPRAAEPAQRLEPQDLRSRFPLALPDALEHELEVRRLDPVAVLGVALDGDLVQHRLDELGLDRDRLPRQLVPAARAAQDRRARGGAIEMLEAHLVREHVRHARLEGVELGEAVLAQGDEHVAPATPAGAPAGTRAASRNRRRRGRGSTPRTGRGSRYASSASLTSSKMPVERRLPTSRGSRRPRSGPSIRSSRATPAPSSEVLPTPLDP